ncbi:hypothetical protein IJ556_02235 [bacterium]|nr:hypothetical protein [bacterium]
MLKELFAMVEMLKARAYIKEAIGEVESMTVWEDHGADKALTVDTKNGFDYVMNLDGSNEGKFVDFARLKEECSTFILYAETKADETKVTESITKIDYLGVSIYYADIKWATYFEG